MSIVTKTGDRGETHLYSGERVPKSHIRVEAVGALDELSALLAGLKQEPVQAALFVLGAAVANTQVGSEQELLKDELTDLETQIEAWEAALPALKHFILPGGHAKAIQAHQARAVCRRAERLLCQIPNLPANALPYLNRLSDYLFMLARKINFNQSIADIPWQP